VEEILVFRDHDATALTGVPPDLKVRRFTEPEFHDVHTITADGSEKPRQGCRELVVNEEFHEVASTM
jgi:hypothetical protein